MGTNYYFFKEAPCDKCGRRDSEGTHIGKASIGWRFLIHIYPDACVNTIKDWEAILRLDEEGTYIEDEYDERMSVDELLKYIESKKDEQRHDDGTGPVVTSHNTDACDYSTADFC